MYTHKNSLQPACGLLRRAGVFWADTLAQTGIVHRSCAKALLLSAYRSLTCSVQSRAVLIKLIVPCLSWSRAAACQNCTTNQPTLRLRIVKLKMVLTFL